MTAKKQGKENKAIDVFAALVVYCYKKVKGAAEMKILFKGGTVVNVFTGETEKKNVLIEDGIIIGVGDYTEADRTEDVTGKYICPGFIDGHIHIESTMMTPPELAKALLPHGTVGIAADPHEIANVCGAAGIEYMLEQSRNLPMDVYMMLPSCVPSTPFDESGAVLSAEDLKPFYAEKRVLGLAEMMNYPGVIAGDEEIKEKIADAESLGKCVDGHAPLLLGKDLDKYISAGISSDHECSTFEEATEKIRKGQWVMIRQGTAARNLEGLIDLFDEPWRSRCLLVTDDRHPADILNEGHIDSIIRRAAELGKPAVVGIQMASIHAAQRFGLKGTGAVAPGYRADILVLNDLDRVDIRDVYKNGVKVVDNKRVIDFEKPAVNESLSEKVLNSFHVKPLSPEDFHIEGGNRRCRVIKTIPKQLLTDEWITNIDLGKNGGVDLERDILKIAVIERHKNTGHKGVGFISGIGLKRGAIASSVSHDSHNLIVIGTNDADMACAANCVISMGGGYAAAEKGETSATLPLPIAGLMSEESAESIAEGNAELKKVIRSLGVPEGTEPLMHMAFVSLSVIPSLKMTTKGLTDVNSQKLVSLFAE